MAQLGTQRLADINTCTTPTSQNLPTFEQVLQGEEAVWPPNGSPVAKNNEQEDNHTTHSKKSVFTKVKEKAKKLRNSFSGKKKRGDESRDGDSTPPWDVTLEDDENDDNPEYLGAPMYESELAPDNYKNATSQHQQEVPLALEKHVLESSIKHVAAKEKNDPPSGSIKQLNKSASKKPAPKTAAVSEFRSHKPAQSYSVFPNVTQTVCDETAGQAIENPEAKKDGNCAGSKAASPRTAKTGRDGGCTVASSRATDGSAIASPRAVDTGKNAGEVTSKSDGNSETREHRTNTNPQTWDKGVSVKEYLMQKLKPGEDEKALSQVISNAMSPRKSPDDIGVVGKVKEAVTSLLRPEQEPSQSSTKTTGSSSNNPVYEDSSQSTSNTSSLSHSSPAPIETNSSLHTSQKPVASPNTNSSPHIPISTNPYEVVQEGSHERILQTN